MSHPPSISSQVSVLANATRSKAPFLPTMKLPRNVHLSPHATSVEYIYDADDNDNEPAKVIYSVNDTVAIHPSGEIFLDANGEIPLMSYWFGKITKFYLQSLSRGAGHCVWVEVLWLYRAEDVRAEEQSFADHMGKYELAESDHVSIVNVTCIERHVNVRRFAERDLSNRSIASDELYIRWKIAVKVRGRAGCDTSLESARVMEPLICCIQGCSIRLYDPKLRQRYCRCCRRWFHQRCIRDFILESRRNQLPALVKNKTTYSIELDQAFLALLRTPVARGGIHGTSGNGMIMCSTDAALQFALLRGHLEENWNQLLDTEDAWPMEYPVEYFTCPCCDDSWI